MNPSITWQDMAIRLTLTVLAAGLIGINRGERGRPAGLRTTVLVGLVGCASMLEANLLLGTAGKLGNSFVNIDVMRLPLGVLTGMGFIGAGAIFHRGSFVTGVTTAATLWFVTMMGICLGSGEIGLGLSLLGLGIIVIWAMKWIEVKWKHHRGAFIMMRAGAGGPDPAEFSRILAAAGYKLAKVTSAYTENGTQWQIDAEVRWHGSMEDNARTPAFLPALASQPGVIDVRWDPHP